MMRWCAARYGSALHNAASVGQGVRVPHYEIATHTCAGQGRQAYVMCVDCRTQNAPPYEQNICALMAEQGNGIAHACGGTATGHILSRSYADDTSLAICAMMRAYSAASRRCRQYARQHMRFMRIAQIFARKRAGNGMRFVQTSRWKRRAARTLPLPWRTLC